MNLLSLFSCDNVRSFGLKYYVFLFFILFFNIKSHTQIVGSTVTPCDKKDYVFKGDAAKTLCDWYWNMERHLIVGEGSTNTHSSQIGSSFTGNVYVTGDFIIDENFSFIDCVVRVETGVKIIVQTSTASELNNLLTIDNTKLFACDDLWAGIELQSHTTIKTLNGTKIEDAVSAIYANNVQQTFLAIETTTFNRNHVGILLTQAPDQTGGATITKFRNNRFYCDAPLNGTVDQVSLAGIRTVNMPISISPDVEANFNRFSNLQYGIIAEGGNTIIAGRYFRFQNIMRDGIFLTRGSIDIEKSNFNNCEEKAINIGTALQVNIKNTIIKIENDITYVPDNVSRVGVCIERFGLNSNVRLEKNLFDFELSNINERAEAINLKGNNVASGTSIYIIDNGFNIDASGSKGVYLDGLFPGTSEIHLYLNRFNCSSNTQYSTRSIDIEDTKNNLNIYSNFFDKHSTNPGHSNGIGFLESDGVNNRIEDNRFVLNGSLVSNNFAVFRNIDNLTICSNVIAANNGGNVGFYFSGSNLGTDFTKNQFYGTKIGINLLAGAIIGPQVQKGNEWRPLPSVLGGWRAEFQAKCTNCDIVMAAANRFTVHEPQSIWDEGMNQYTSFSEYHPENITPDTGNEFFDIDTEGAPASSCISQLTNTTFNSLDYRIANENFSSSQNHPSTMWMAKRYLFNKIERASQSSGGALDEQFNTFVDVESLNTIGRFNDVNNVIQTANECDFTLDIDSQVAIDNLILAIDTVIVIDSLLYTTNDQLVLNTLFNQKASLFQDIVIEQNNYDLKDKAYLINQENELQSALVINDAIVPSEQYEINEKEVNEIFIRAKSEQNSILTESQITVLKSIAEQCPETGGRAVTRAYTLLPVCERKQVNFCTPILEYIDNNPSLSSMGDYLHIQNKTTENEANIVLYPNPSYGFFSLKFPELSTGCVTVSGFSGKQLIKKDFQRTRDFTLVHNLSPGVYVVRIQHDTENVIIEKLIVQ